MTARAARWSDTRIAIVVGVSMTLLVGAGVYGVDRFTSSYAEHVSRVVAGAPTEADEAQSRVNEVFLAERSRLLGLATDELGVQLSADVAAGVLPSAPDSWQCETPDIGTYSEGDRLMEARCTANLKGVDGDVQVAYRAQVDTVTDVTTAVRAPDLDALAP